MTESRIAVLVVIIVELVIWVLIFRSAPWR
jgi:hypothetical protein